MNRRRRARIAPAPYKQTAKAAVGTQGQQLGQKSIWDYRTSKQHPGLGKKQHVHHCDAPLRGLVGVRPAAGRERVELVKEEDAGVGGPRARKQLPHRSLALPHVLVQQLGALHRFLVFGLRIQGLGFPGFRFPGSGFVVRT